MKCNDMRRLVWVVSKTDPGTQRNARPDNTLHSEMPLSTGRCSNGSVCNEGDAGRGDIIGSVGSSGGVGRGSSSISSGGSSSGGAETSSAALAVQAAQVP